MKLVQARVVKVSDNGDWALAVPYDSNIPVGLVFLHCSRYCDLVPTRKTAEGPYNDFLMIRHQAVRDRRGLNRHAGLSIGTEVVFDACSLTLRKGQLHHQANWTLTDTVEALMHFICGHRAFYVCSVIEELGGIALQDQNDEPFDDWSDELDELLEASPPMSWVEFRAVKLVARVLQNAKWGVCQTAECLFTHPLR